MRYRRLGRTDLEVSAIGFGASPLGDVFGRTEAGQRNRAVALAIERGINFFDVSPYYGLTLAEERLGDALRGRRQKVLLATKCGRYGQGEFDFSAARVHSSLEESLRRLGTDSVDLLQAHDVEFGDFNQIIEETIPSMRRLQEAGKARYIGVTGYPLGMLARIAEAVPVDTVLSYCRYNLLSTEMDAVLTPLAAATRVGLINASPLVMGLLTDQGPPEWHPAPKEVKDAARKAAQFCRKRGVNISQLALRFCFDHPYVAGTLVGMSTSAEVESALAAFETAQDDGLLAEVRALLAPVLDRHWSSGRAENSD